MLAASSSSTDSRAVLPGLSAAIQPGCSHPPEVALSVTGRETPEHLSKLSHGQDGMVAGACSR